MRVNPPVGTTGAAAATDLVEQIIHYHLQTKHHFHRYARSAGYLDWANQPDPFRRYRGATMTPLPLLEPDEAPRSPSYEDLYRAGSIRPQPVTVAALSRFFEFALALSAWKRAGTSEWALRSNPSSGNLHPTEGYVLLPSIEGLDLNAGLYHYAPKEHGLELRAAFRREDIAGLLHPFSPHAFLFGLTSVHWREAWKYGERAFRYCHHDAGHAIGTARIAASTLGWKAVVLDGCDQETVGRLLGTEREEDYVDAEREHPDCMMIVWPSDATTQHGRSTMPLYLDPTAVQTVVKTTWYGKANRLSADHGFDWEIIDTAAQAAWKTESEIIAIASGGSHAGASSSTTGPCQESPNAGQIIRQRRSAVAFDAKTSMTAATFFSMLGRVMPHVELPQPARPMPWDSWSYEPAIHLMLFVHRIEGLTPGLYFLVRDPGKLTFIQQSMNPEIVWQQAPDCPDGLPLYWLLEGDARKLAAQVSCHQDIAGDGAFSLGMLAEFEGTLRQRGAWWYPRMFWEAGLLGQVLYLEAEAAGVRATGIGCFFDDPVHEIVALKGLSLQSLYHFTIGGPVEDRRLMTLPPYGHLGPRPQTTD
ncbi:MAG TPA: SagB/ThcOx family dehydrogenase [Nitrospira sp.]|nr:SagB/ThcOx family dehydrogenase [Nitrospira sp.]